MVFLAITGRGECRSDPYDMTATDKNYDEPSLAGFRRQGVSWEDMGTWGTCPKWEDFLILLLTYVFFGGKMDKNGVF